MDNVMLILGWALVSASITYAWWVKARVWIFRQRLFKIRDELWYAMRDAGTLDDPGHIKVRRGINALIQFAPRLSIPTLKVMAKLPRDERPKDLTPVVEEAYLAVSRQMANYVLLATVSGWVAIVRAMIDYQRHTIKNMTKSTSKLSRQAFDTREMREVDWENPATAA